MKVSINSKFIHGPFGGAMQFANSIRTYLEDRGIEVVNDLQDDDVDIILHVCPFPFIMRAGAYTFFDAYIYKLLHPETVIVCRMNECDERKGTTYMNKLLAKVRKYSDFTVYIAGWLRELLYEEMIDKSMPYQVIYNGGDETIFYSDGTKSSHMRDGVLKLVTHHWSDHKLKGHDIYQRLDEYVCKHPDRFSFTYIGRIPKGITYKHSQLLAPISGKELGNELRKYDAYITASRNEPGGMHHVEGALSGLPILYINSGSFPEMCSGFGIEFTEENFEEKLELMYREFEIWKKKMTNYSYTSENMCDSFLELIYNLYKNKLSFRARGSSFQRSLRALGIKLYGKTFSTIFGFMFKTSIRCRKLIRMCKVF